MKRKRILIVYYNQDADADTRLTMLQHIRALEASDVGHTVRYYNAVVDCPPQHRGDTALQPPEWIVRTDFDAIVLHYSFLAFHWNETVLLRWKRLFRWIGELDTPKAAMPQDEYDRAGLLDEWLFEWNVSTLFTLHDEDHIGPLYPLMRRKAKIYHCLPGYIDERAAAQDETRVRQADERRYDIVYRARHLPFWFGDAAQLKHRVGDIVAVRAKALGFTADISTRAEDVIPGSRWLDFLASSRAVVGCESGVSALDWRGETEARVRAILRQDPSLPFAEVSARMPPGWDAHRFVCVSPRHFEAITTRTCQVLVEGEYSGVLKADRHYIPIHRSFDNVDEALEQLRDRRLVQDLVERAYEDIVRSGKYTYRAFARDVENALFPNEADTTPKPVFPLVVIDGGGAMDDAVASLERQLVAERHERSFLEATLTEAHHEIGALTSQVRVTKRMAIIVSAVSTAIGALVAALVMLAWVVVTGWCGVGR